MADKVEVIITAKDEVSKTLGNITNSMKGMGVALGGAVVAGAAVAGAAIVGIGAAAVNVGLEFDDAMDSIAAMTGNSGPALAGMEDILKNLRGTTAGLGVDLGQMGDVLGTAAVRTGATGAALEEFTGNILDFSRVTGTDAVANTENITRVMGDWGIEMEDSGQLLDMMLQASQSTGIGVDALAQKVVQFGAPLRQMGFSLEDSAALLGKWEKEGVNSELVLGSLRIAMGNFARDGIPMREGLDATIKKIQELGPGAESTALAMEVFGARAGPDMAAAILEGRFSIEELTETLEGATGTLDRAVEGQMGFTENLEIMKNKATMALEPLGTAFLNVADSILVRLQPALDGLAPIIETVADVISSFFANLEEGMSPLDAFIEAIWDIAPPELLSTLVDFRDNILPGLVEKFTAVKDKVLEFVAPIITAVANFVSFKDVLIALGLVLGGVVLAAIWGVITAMAPLLLIVGAVVGVIALARNAWESNFLGIRDITQAVIDFIKPFIENALASIRAWWDAHGAAIMAAAQQAWNFIQNVITTVINIIRSIVTTVLSAIQAFWQAWGDTLLASAKAIWEAIKGLIEGVINQVKGIIDLFRLAVAGEWEAFGRKLFDLWKNAWDTILNFIRGIWNAILPIFQNLWQSIQSWWNGIDWGALGRNLVNKIVSGIQAAGGAILSVLMGIAKSAWEAVIGFFKGSAGSAAQSATSGGGGSSAQMIGGGKSGFAFGGMGFNGMAASGNTTIVNIDARGAARGVDRDIRQMVIDVLREQGLRADVRMRTGY